MASVDELIRLAEHESRVRNPAASAIQNLLLGVQNAQQGGLDRTIKLMQMDQMRRENEQQAEMAAQIKAQTDAQNEAAITQGHKAVGGGGAPVLPVQKLQVEISQDEKGRYSRKFKTAETTPKEAGSIDAILAQRVQRGEMTLEDAIAMKSKSQGASPSLQYQKDKDAKKAATDLKELQIPGYELSGDVQPLKEEARSLRDTVGRMSDFNKGVDQLIGLIKKHGSTNTMGEGSGEMESLASTLKLTLKDIAKLGQISGGDIAIMDAQIFDPTQVKSVKTTTANAIKQLETAKAKAQSSVDEALKARSYVPTGGAKAPGDAIVATAKTVNTQEEYDALPSGAEYIDSEGNKGRKR